MKARSLEGQYAGFLSRAAALFLDYAVVAAMMAIFGIVVLLLLRAVDMNLLSCRRGDASTSATTVLCTGAQLIVALAALLTAPVYLVLCWTLVGQTIGQRVMGVRVLRLDGGSIGLARSFLRFLGYQVCFATFGIGFLWVLVDDRRLGWHDKIARTCVVYSWKAVQNESLIERVNAFFGHKRRE